jgi:hypothetical protein
MKVILSGDFHPFPLFVHLSNATWNNSHLLQILTTQSSTYHLPSSLHNISGSWNSGLKYPNLNCNWLSCKFMWLDLWGHLLLAASDLEMQHLILQNLRVLLANCHHNKWLLPHETKLVLRL